MIVVPPQKTHKKITDLFTVCTLEMKVLTKFEVYLKPNNGELV